MIWVRRCEIVSSCLAEELAAQTAAQALNPYVEVHEYPRALNLEDFLPNMRSRWRSKGSAQFKVSIFNLACLSPAEVRRPSATHACHGSWTELKIHLASKCQIRFRRWI